MAALGISQADLVGKTGLNKTAISLPYNDRQDYSPEVVRDVAAALNIAIYELFMPPQDAMSIRAFHRDAIRVVASGTRLGTPRPESTERTGTDG